MLPCPKSSLREIMCFLVYQASFLFQGVFFLLLCVPFTSQKINFLFQSFSYIYLNELLESTVDGGSDVGDVLPEVDGEESALGDALGGELELL